MRDRSTRKKTIAKSSSSIRARLRTARPRNRPLPTKPYLLRPRRCLLNTETRPQSARRALVCSCQFEVLVRASSAAPPRTALFCNATRHKRIGTDGRALSRGVYAEREHVVIARGLHEIIVCYIAPTCALARFAPSLPRSDANDYRPARIRRTTTVLWRWAAAPIIASPRPSRELDSASGAQARGRPPTQKKNRPPPPPSNPPRRVATAGIRAVRRRAPV